MKKFFTFLFCLILPFCILLTGCSNEPQNETPKQITLQQIIALINESEKPNITGYENLQIHSQMSETLDTLHSWRNKLELQNVNGSNLTMLYSLHYYPSSSVNTRFYIYMFKFTNSEDAMHCSKNYYPETSYINKNNCTVKTYGNLAIYVDNTISDFVFNLIDTI